MSAAFALWALPAADELHAQTPPSRTPSASPTPTASASPSPTTASHCGDRRIEGAEQCDDGDQFGGDGCSANCTFETTHVFAIAPERAGFRFQTFLAGFSPDTPSDLDASLTMVTGSPGTDGRIPVAVRANPDMTWAIQVRQACTCIRLVETPAAFGPGNAGAGWIGCAGLDPVDFTLEQDHATEDVDPECIALDSQTGDAACLETTDGGPACNPASPHDGVCNGPLRTLPGAGGTNGSAVLWAAVSATVMFSPESDVSQGCGPHPGDPIYGPDGLPCTADDPDQRPARIIPISTGRVASRILDANGIAEATVADGHVCGQSPCLVVATGAPFDCEQLAGNPDEGIAGTTDGAALAMSVPIVDAFNSRDTAVTYWLNTANGPVNTATPSRTPSMTPTQTPVVTPSPTFTPSPTTTPTRTKTPTITRTPTATRTSSRTPTGPTRTPTRTGSPTQTGTATTSPTPTPTATTTSTPSSTPSQRPSATSTAAPASPTPSASPTTANPTASPTSPAPSATPTGGQSPTPSEPPSPSPSPTSGVIRGDANNDGVVTTDDLTALIALLFKEGEFQGASRPADANGDWRLDAADLPATIAVIGASAQ